MAALLLKVNQKKSEHRLPFNITYTQESGMEDKTAEVLAENQLAMLETQIATKADMYDVKSYITTELSSIKKDLG